EWLELSESIQKAARMYVDQLAFELRRGIPQLEIVERSNLDAAVKLVLIGSPGDKAGIKDGDLIIKLDGMPLMIRQDLSKQFTKDFTVTIRRDTEEKDYVVHVDRQ